MTTFFLSPSFPLHHLKRLHGDLDQLEMFLQINYGGYKAVKDDIEKIYRVQEIIEDIVRKESRKEVQGDEEDEIINLDF